MIEPTAEMVRLVVNRFLDGPTSTIGEIDAGMHYALAAALTLFVQRVEGKRGTGLCDCDNTDDPPISPRTAEPMDHHCDCRAVETAAALLGGRAETQHAKACVCGPPP